MAQRSSQTSQSGHTFRYVRDDHPATAPTTATTGLPGTGFASPVPAPAAPGAATGAASGTAPGTPPRPARLRLVERGERPADPAEGLSAAHVHTAAELREEVAAAGFDDVRVTGVEAPGSLALRLVPPDDQVVAAAVVLAERAQGHPASPDLSGHLLAVARR